MKPTSFAIETEQQEQPARHPARNSAAKLLRAPQLPATADCDVRMQQRGDVAVSAAGGAAPAGVVRLRSPQEGLLRRPPAAGTRAVIRFVYIYIYIFIE